MVMENISKCPWHSGTVYSNLLYHTRVIQYCAYYYTARIVIFALRRTLIVKAIPNALYNAALNAAPNEEQYAAHNAALNKAPNAASNTGATRSVQI